ncbi:ArsR/SmtB family transcription factor [Paenibacillus radicis (ex Xue et al. 2023)]|uniref:Helix-turn-helix domain-containing protein n=1 Tax=Paenibacillus radicis (ex Xue et al. 2023) TaxID=2972489 RepID=A0ABT1YTJ9_9BACL|nr:ArsR family transcriptional regulator [Paenibacillus radicis (ex Xue et al. 2023)]MCR8635310.1 helix-turn-helix domain-containing protein [Paenibacillus radicis (ex Xue et al. 2023)]
MAEPTDTMRRIPAHQIQEVAKALAGDLRLRILEALGERPKSITQLVEELGVAQPTVSINVQALEQAGLLTSSQGSGREKICARTLDKLLFELPMRPGEGLHEVEELSMPVGLYTDCEIGPPCGLYGLEGKIGCPDDPRAFYMPERVQANMLWFSEAGYVEYSFANPLPKGIPLQQLMLSAELCSEAEGYNQEWPSDISLSINGKSIGTWTCQGDFGDRKGKLSSNIPLGSSQYGLLTEWSISDEGSCINGEKSAETVLSDLNLHYNRPIKVRLEVHKAAKNCRGLNLFGSGYGDHPQDIKLRFVRKAD